MPQHRAKLDHLCFAVPQSRFEEVTEFYIAALEPIGYTKQFEYGQAIGLGQDKLSADFWISSLAENEFKGMHIAFRASEHETVDKFHAAALKAGGTCNGKPGIREMYHPNYYAAFVLDPLGNNIEIVDHSAH